MAAKRGGRTVSWQRTSVRLIKAFRGEKSPYWDWVHLKGFRNSDGEPQELSLANPDILAGEEEASNPDVDTRALMRLAIKKAKFSRGEKAVLECIGIQGFTEEKTAEILDISRRQVRVCMSRAIKKCERAFVAIRRLAGVMGREAHTEED